MDEKGLRLLYSEAALKVRVGKSKMEGIRCVRKGYKNMIFWYSDIYMCCMAPDIKFPFFNSLRIIPK